MEMTKAVNMKKIYLFFLITWPEHQVHHPWRVIPGGLCCQQDGGGWVLIGLCQAAPELLLPASTTKELQSILSIDFLHANLISLQQKDHLETFLKREALMLCLSKMLQTLWECWADCAGGVFVSQVSMTVLPHCPLFCWYRLLTLPTTCSVYSWFCYSNLPDSFVSGHGGNISLILVQPSLDQIFPLLEAGDRCRMCWIRPSPPVQGLSEGEIAHPFHPGADAWCLDRLSCSPTWPLRLGARNAA